MTGIERLHGIAKASRGYTWSQSLSYTLEDIAKQIEREQAKDHKIAESVRKYGPIGADYLPIRNGDEVWAVRDGNGPFKVVSIDLGAELPITLTRGDGGILMARCTPDELTHTKPEKFVDSWERIEKDALKCVENNAGDKERMKLNMLSFVRRAKALARTMD